MGKLLTVKALKAYYKLRLGEKLRAVDGVSLTLQEGEVLGIAGESGCGKSTLASCLSGLFFPPLKYQKGNITLDGIDIIRTDKRTLRKSILGKKISFIPQSAMNALNPTLKIEDFVADVMQEHEPDLSREEAIKRAEERFEVLSLPKDVLKAYPFELSGGMKQRTIVILSTLMNPEIVIADEPTSALDVSSQRQVIELMKRLLQMKITKSMIFITHELPILRHVADRIAIMYAGVFLEVGTMPQIIFDPRHPYTKVLMSSIIVPEKGMRERKLPLITGRPPDLRKRIKGCRFAKRCPYATDECRMREPDMEETDGRKIKCFHPLKGKEIKQNEVI